MKRLFFVVLCVCMLTSVAKGEDMEKKDIVVLETTQGVIEIKLHDRTIYSLIQI